MNGARDMNGLLLRVGDPVEFKSKALLPAARRVKIIEIHHSTAHIRVSFGKNVKDTVPANIVQLLITIPPKILHAKQLEQRYDGYYLPPLMTQYDLKNESNVHSEDVGKDQEILQGAGHGPAGKRLLLSSYISGTDPGTDLPDRCRSQGQMVPYAGALVVEKQNNR